MNRVPEINLEIVRGDTRPLMFRFRTGVNSNAVAIDLAGSSFLLELMDYLGDVVLTVNGTIMDDQVHFAPSLAQLAALRPGNSGRFQITRFIDSRAELWLAGPTQIIGVS